MNQWLMQRRPKKFWGALFWSLCFMTFLTAPEPACSQPPRPRTIITADPEPDDLNSLIRLLLYSNELNIEGLIYASSQFHWKGDGQGTKWFVPGREYDRFGLNLCPCESWRWAKEERFIHDAVEAYTKVYTNLRIHAPHYPTPEYLKSKIRYGNIDFDGDISKDTPGSDLIKSLILDEKPGPLFITAWGGHITIARALKSIQDTYQYTSSWETIRAKIARKVILLPSGDQDDTYANYIKPHWPDIEARQFRQGPNYGYGAQIRASAENKAYLTSAWMKTNVSDRGPLGALYRVWGDGKQMVKGDVVDYFGLSGYTVEELKKMGYAVWMPPQDKGSWLGEGDNHTFMNMLGQGLRAYEHGSYGGWGGRTLKQVDNSNPFALPADSSAEALAARISNQTSTAQVSFPDFFPQAQNDFAARLKWSVTTSYTAANHAPQIQVMGPLTVMANPGQKIKLHAHASDPDGDTFALRWWVFPVGSYSGKVELTNENSPQVSVQVPSDASAGQTVHLIAEATDNGAPKLTSYQRVIITIREQ